MNRNLAVQLFKDRLQLTSMKSFINVQRLVTLRSGQCANDPIDNSVLLASVGSQDFFVREL